MSILKFNDFVDLCKNVHVNESEGKYKYFPNHIGELISVIRERIEKEGNECDLNDIDVSNINNMSWLFSTDGFAEFNGNISEWNVSNVKYMTCMFFNSKFNGDISKWNVSNVKNMDNMFENAKMFDQDLSLWDVSNVVSKAYMFNGATQMKQHPEKQPVFLKKKKNETGYWHGENATVLYNDGEDVTFIVGNYNEPMLAKIKRLFAADDPRITKYDDYIITVPAEEWKEQNEID